MLKTPARDQAESIRKRYSAEADAVRADRRLSDFAKQRLLAGKYVTTTRRLAELQRLHNDVIQEEHRRLQHAAFGYSSDPAAFRLALDSATKVESQEQALAALRRAERTGDPVAAAAVFEIAAERGYRQVVADYTDRRPAAADALAQLEQHEHDMGDLAERIFSPFHVARPLELPTRQAELDRLALDVPNFSDIG